MSNTNDQGQPGTIAKVVAAMTGQGAPKNGNGDRQRPGKPKALRTDAEPLALPEAAIQPGMDMYDQALNAACAVIRERLLAGTGNDKAVQMQHFAPNGSARREFYAAMADYAAAELLTFRDRFSMKKEPTEFK